MKNKILISLTAFSLLLSCALTLNAADNTKAAQDAWEKLTAYKEVSNQTLELMSDLEKIAKFTEKGLEAHLATKKSVKEVLEKSTETLKESKTALKANEKYDAKLFPERLPANSSQSPSDLKLGTTNDKSVLDDIDAQKKIITDYANAK